MLPLLERAQTLFRRSQDTTSVVPVPFEVFCESGHPVRGHRWTQYQIPQCPECGNVVFVLPMSPLPAPEAPAVPEPAPVRPKRSRPRLRLKLRTRVVQRRLLEGLKAWKPPARWFARERLVVAAIVTIVLVTGVVLLANARHARSLAVLQEQLKRGNSTFEQGEFAEASVAFEEAEAAALYLGPGATGSLEALQLAGEAALLAHLGTTRLDLIAREAQAAAESNGIDEWASRFRVLYEGKGYLFDGWVVPRGSGDDAVYEFDFVLFEGDDRFEVDVASLALFKRLGLTEPQRLVFGARLIALEPSMIEPKRWLFRLLPESGVLLTRSKPLERLGWPRDEELQRVLSRQQAWAEELAREDLQ